jgi:hypothetical protein
VGPNRYLAIALLAVPVGAAFGQAPEPRVVYTATCAACHGDDGRGRSSSELGFDVALPDFTDCDFAVREPNSDWYAIAHRGGPIRGFNRLMPAFGEALSAAELEAALVRIRQFCTDARWPRGELNLPRALFTEKAYPEDEAVITTTLVGEGLDSIHDRETFHDPSTVTGTSQHGYADNHWSDGWGNYLHTDDPSLDPNIGSTVQWERLQRVE